MKFERFKEREEWFKVRYLTAEDVAKKLKKFFRGVTAEDVVKTIPYNYLKEDGSILYHNWVEVLNKLSKSCVRNKLRRIISARTQC